MQPNSILLTPVVNSNLSYSCSYNSAAMSIDNIGIHTKLRMGGIVIGEFNTPFNDLIKQQALYAKYEPEQKERITLLLEKMIEDMIEQLEIIKST